jgi:hypothetical protein
MVLALAGTTFAAIRPVPEIDPAMGVNAVALLGGAALIIRSRRK